MRGRKKKRNHGDPRFIMLFHYVYDSEAVRTLCPNSLRVYLEFLRKFNGRNDNDLSLTYAELNKKYGLSPTTCRKAFEELIEHGLIDKKICGGLRVGLKTRQCNVFGLSERWKKFKATSINEVDRSNN